MELSDKLNIAINIAKKAKNKIHFRSEREMEGFLLRLDEAFQRSQIFLLKNIHKCETVEDIKALLIQANVGVYYIPIAFDPKKEYKLFQEFNPPSKNKKADQ